MTATLETIDTSIVTPTSLERLETTTTITSLPQPEASESAGEWPEHLADDAFHGLAGDIVRKIEPHTEADPAAILFQFLVAFGNIVGRSPHFKVEATHHHANLFTGIVGETSKARKGTSWGHIDRLFRLLSERTTNDKAEVNWKNRLLSGLGSGEGLIAAVKDDPTQPAVDKRLIVIDSEFASTLTVLNRQGNTLSPVIRNAWDSGDLQIATKNRPMRASESHISIIAHITRDELRRELTATEVANGFANRFLWVCSRRSKLLPDGGNLHETDLQPLVERLAECVGYGQAVGEIKRDEEARSLWHEEYEQLSEPKPGLLGAVIARSEAQTVRLAAIYALLDQSVTVTKAHLEAALAAWRYCESSAAFIFGQSLGDPVADRILEALKDAAAGLTRTQIRDVFQRNQTKARIDEAMEALKYRKLIEKRRQWSGLQEVDTWFAR